MFFIKDKFSGLRGLFDKFGGLILIIANILPFGAEIVAIVAGSIKYKFRKFIVYSIAGMAVKYCGMFFLKHYLTENLLPEVKEFFSFI